MQGAVRRRNGVVMASTLFREVLGLGRQNDERRRCGFVTEAALLFLRSCSCSRPHARTKLARILRPRSGARAALKKDGVEPTWAQSTNAYDGRAFVVLVFFAAIGTKRSPRFLANCSHAIGEVFIIGALRAGSMCDPLAAPSTRRSAASDRNVHSRSNGSNFSDAFDWKILAKAFVAATSSTPVQQNCVGRADLLISLRYWRITAFNPSTHWGSNFE